MSASKTLAQQIGDLTRDTITLSQVDVESVTKTLEARVDGASDFDLAPQSANPIPTIAECIRQIKPNERITITLPRCYMFPRHARTTWDPIRELTVDFELAMPENVFMTIRRREHKVDNLDPLPPFDIEDGIDVDIFESYHKYGKTFTYVVDLYCCV